MHTRMDVLGPNIRLLIALEKTVLMASITLYQVNISVKTKSSIISKKIIVQYQNQMIGDLTDPIILISKKKFLFLLGQILEQSEGSQGYSSMKEIERMSFKYKLPGNTII